MILLFLMWLFNPGVKEGLRKLKENKAALLLAGLFLIHIIWLFNTSDFEYALKDIRIKLPLLFLALVVGSISIDRNQLKLIFLSLSLGIWLATILAYFRYANLPPNFHDYREIVQGISHIRLSLLMIMQVIGVVYFWNELSPPWKVFAVAVLINTVIFFNVLQSATGIIILLVLIGAFALLFAIRKAKPKVAILVGIVSLAILGVGLAYSVNYYNSYFAVADKAKPLDTKTARGNEYRIFPEVGLVENGNRTYDYFANDEMIEAWNIRSTKPMAADTEDVSLNFTLMRYLTSKGLRKDYEGVMALSNQDIENIENGYPNEIYANESGLKLRFHTFMFGLHVFNATGDVSGLSFFQRIIYWNTAVEIIQDNWLLGVGTGDVKNEFRLKHQEINQGLDERYWLRAHNQFLTFFVTFGILGFSYYLFLFAYSFRLYRKDFLKLAFLLVAFISCLTEDTLESQAGVTFFSFFFALLCKPPSDSEHE